MFHIILNNIKKYIERLDSTRNLFFIILDMHNLGIYYFPFHIVFSFKSSIDSYRHTKNVET